MTTAQDDNQQPSRNPEDAASEPGFDPVDWATIAGTPYIHKSLRGLQDHEECCVGLFFNPQSSYVNLRTFQMAFRTHAAETIFYTLLTSLFNEEKPESADLLADCLSRSMSRVAKLIQSKFPSIKMEARVTHKTEAPEETPSGDTGANP